MKYEKVREAVFLKRPNRFIAIVECDGKEEMVHVPNTGRCKELFIPGAKVILRDCSENLSRKTRYSLVSVYKGDRLVNIDSQSPNAIVEEGILEGKIPWIMPDLVIREKTFENSRFDLYYEKNGVKGFVEVKGVTLEKEGLALFPDAPTQRGRKHLQELRRAVACGYEASLVFLIQMKGPKEFTPNREMDPLFYEEVLLAQREGVRIYAYDSLVEKDRVILDQQVTVSL